jgi:hypothetical protein
MRNQLRVAAAEARGHFENPEEAESLPVEAVTRRLMKTQLTEKI